MKQINQVKKKVGGNSTSITSITMSGGEEETNSS
jgi:hypothetical protein